MREIRSSGLRAFANFCGLGVAFASSGALADAISLSASSTYSFEFIPSQTISASRPSDPTDPDILVSAMGFREQGIAVSTVLGHDYSSQPSGIYQFGSRSSGEGAYSITGSANYTNTFTAAAGGKYTFNFDIDAGELSVSLPDNADGTQSASLRVLITETIGSGNPMTLFDYNASMTVLGQTLNPTFLETGAKLNAAGAALPFGAGDYVWNAYHGSVGLGTLSRGQIVTISETLFSSATGKSACTVSDTGGNGGGGDSSFALLALDSQPFCATALARIGDPPTVTTPIEAPSIVSPAVAVPEPSTFVMLGAGFASLLLARRRRQS